MGRWFDSNWAHKYRKTGRWPVFLLRPVGIESRTEGDLFAKQTSPKEAGSGKICAADLCVTDCIWWTPRVRTFHHQVLQGFFCHFLSSSLTNPGTLKNGLIQTFFPYLCHLFSEPFKLFKNRKRFSVKSWERLNFSR